MVLLCKDITIGYEGKTVAKGINFEVNEGDYVCIIGENGAGKSTLVKTLLGFQEPLSGRVQWEVDRHKDTIGFLAQQKIVQRDFPASVMEIVLSGFLNQSGYHPFYRKSQRVKAKEIMNKLSVISLSL